MAPPSPRHIIAQQLLALALQEHTLGLRTLPEWWNGLDVLATDGSAVLDHLIEAGFLETDGDLAFIGPRPRSGLAAATSPTSAVECGTSCSA